MKTRNFTAEVKVSPTGGGYELSARTFQLKVGGEEPAYVFGFAGNLPEEGSEQSRTWGYEHYKRHVAIHAFASMAEAASWLARLRARLLALDVIWEERQREAAALQTLADLE